MSDNEYKSYEYASVYLLDNPYSIDTTYDYFIPYELRADVYRGVFVTVPFGRGNRKHMALVDSLCRAPSVKNVKPVVSVCKDRTALSEEIMQLCRYMKEQVLCTVGDAVRCAVPSAILGKLSEYYYPAPGRQPDGSAGFSPADLFVYNYIVSRPYVGIDTLKSKFGASASLSSVKKLVEKGYVCKELKTGEACAGAYENYYRAVCGAEEFKRIIDKTADVKVSSEKQKEVLGLLVESSKELGAKEIMRLTGATVSQIKALVDKGLVSKTAKRKFRESFCGIPDEKINITLNSEQQTAFEEIKKSIHSGKAEAALLFGVTGSGKTNVMMKAIEERLSGGSFHYLPKEKITDEGPSWIKDGDIFCITTNIKGLDVVHLGFACRRDGQLKLLHASSSYKQVVLSKGSFAQMFPLNKSWTGVRVLRMRE